MSDHTARQLLSELDPATYIEALRRSGRSALEPSFVEHWAGRFNAAVSLLEQGELEPELEKALALFREITYLMAMQERSAIPSYYPYTCVNVLDWFMQDDHGDLEALKRQSVQGLTALLMEVGRYETHSLIGGERFQTVRFEPELALARIKALRDVHAAVLHLNDSLGGDPLSVPWPLRSGASLTDYATDSGKISAVVHLTCFPQTHFHDEVLFLRGIQLSEFCFYGVRIAIEQAMTAIDEKDAEAAQAFLEQATAFSDVLRQIFLLLRTMPPEHFHDFRAAAANASAVQSLNYQLMDILLFDLSEHKIALFKRIPHLHNVLVCYEPRRPCLRSLLRDLPSLLGDAAASVLQAAKLLDRKLLSWRGLHVAFAIEYLAETPVGTGGTTGAPYLKLFLRDTLFEETRRELETADLAGVGGENSESSRPGLEIAPSRELIGPDKAIITEPASPVEPGASP